jgi:hypothetical protein
VECQTEVEEDHPQWHTGLEEEEGQADKAPEHGVASMFIKDNVGSKMPPLMNSATG